MYGFQRKMAPMLQPEEYRESTGPQNIQMEQYFHNQKRS